MARISSLLFILAQLLDALDQKVERVQDMLRKEEAAIRLLRKEIEELSSASSRSRSAEVSSDVISGGQFLANVAVMVIVVLLVLGFISNVLDNAPLRKHFLFRWLALFGPSHAAGVTAPY
jgi:hypothetical protein